MGTERGGFSTDWSPPYDEISCQFIALNPPQGETFQKLKLHAVFLIGKEGNNFAWEVKNVTDNVVVGSGTEVGCQLSKLHIGWMSADAWSGKWIEKFYEITENHAGDTFQAKLKDISGGNNWTLEVRLFVNTQSA